jgi:copper chaperone
LERELSVPEVHCDHCVSSIEGALNALEGIETARVDLDSKSVKIDYNESKVEMEAIVGAIEDQGYQVGDSPRLHQISKPEAGDSHGSHNGH